MSFILASKMTAINLLWLITSNLSAKQYVPDSLEKASFSHLEKTFYNNRNNKTQAIANAQIWLSKAKKMKNIEQQVLAYKALAYASLGEKNQHTYIDSMISVALKSNNEQIIGSAYLSKGIYLYQDLNHQQALDNYLLADAYISRTNNPYQSFKVRYQIAQTKYHLGFYDEAIALLKQCESYFGQENDRAYLNTLYALSLCYNSLGKFNEARNIITRAKILANNWQIPEVLPYFNLAESLNLLGSKQYDQAQKMANSVIPFFKLDISNLAMAHYVAGKSNWILKNEQVAINHFKKVDQIFSNTKYIRPELLESYEFLINNYKNAGDLNHALFYTDQFIKAEKTTVQDYKYLSSRILRKYNPKKMRAEILELQKTSQNQRMIAYTLLSLMSVSLVAVSYRNVKQRKKYHEKFEALMKKKAETNKNLVTETVRYNEGELGFSEELAQKLLKRLETFESKHEYIEPEMSLQKLAKKLNTNQKYATKLLSHYRGKGTIEYISDLKIDYIIAKLQSDKKFRKYTNKALGLEVGFGSTQIFTRSFKERTGIPPTVFINELNLLDQKTDSQ
ncbi:MAG: AraC family transcriptional regulator [Flavobacteriaceae bacterium]